MSDLDKLLFAIAIGLLPLVMIALSGKSSDLGLSNGMYMLGR